MLPMRLLPTRRRRADVLRGRPEDRWLELIARHAPGRSFADVGCLWGVHGAYAFHALDCGASRVVAIDVNPATVEFDAENARHEDRVEFHRGDINDPDLVAALAPLDVVFCSGVLYHVPDPIWTLTQLRRLAGEALILTTAIVEELDAPHGAVLFPFMDPATRRRLAARSPKRQVGIDTEFLPEKGYGNWFWGLTPSCVLVMLRLAGLRAREILRHRYVLTVVAEPEPVADVRAHHAKRQVSSR
jgi:SAM-dependent methyltransferase